MSHVIHVFKDCTHGLFSVYNAYHTGEIIVTQAGRMSCGGWIKKNGNSYSQATRPQHAVCDLWLSINQLIVPNHVKDDGAEESFTSPWVPFWRLFSTWLEDFPAWLMCEPLVMYQPALVLVWGWAENREWDESSALRSCQQKGAEDNLTPNSRGEFHCHELICRSQTKSLGIQSRFIALLLCGSIWKLMAWLNDKCKLQVSAACTK